jgi:hypothetical protein
MPVWQAARDVLPTEDVTLEVRIQERVPEVLHAPPPRELQELDAEAGGDHPDLVVEPAGRPELAHAGVDQGVPGPRRDDGA